MIGDILIHIPINFVSVYMLVKSVPGFDLEFGRFLLPSETLTACTRNYKIISNDNAVRTAGSPQRIFSPAPDPDVELNVYSASDHSKPSRSICPILGSR